METSHFEREYFVAQGGQKFGPLTARDLSDRLLTADMLVWWEGQSDWLPISEVEDFKGYVRHKPQPFVTSPPGRLHRIPSPSISRPSPPPINFATSLQFLPLAAKVRLTWSFFWRGLVTTVVSLAAGGGMGALLTLPLAMFDAPLPALQLVGVAAGFFVGFLAFHLNVRWLLASQLWHYRLLLTRSDTRAVCEFKTLVFSEQALVTWSFYWRGVVIYGLSVVAGFFLGLFLGYALNAMGLDVAEIQVVAGVASMPVGALFYYGYVHWLLTRSLGRYQLVLVATK